MAGVSPEDPVLARRNRTLAFACAGFFAAMIGVAYASVPLYELFCKVTGYGGTTQRVEQLSDRVLDREITVRFDANVNGGLGWRFEPVQRDVTLKIGETVQVAYRATNISGIAQAGRATFNVTPQSAGAYFNKVQCFCFTDTLLQPGETMDMPVLFYVDPAIVDTVETKGINTLTLSYTFFPIDMPEPVADAGNRSVPATGPQDVTGSDRL